MSNRTKTFGVAMLVASAATCSAAEDETPSESSAASGSGGQGAESGGAAGSGGLVSSSGCSGNGCSADGTTVVDCVGAVVETCGALQSCFDGQCVDACTKAEELKSSVGCEYFPVVLDAYQDPQKPGANCFAVFVGNTFSQPAHLEISHAGQPIDLAQYGFLPKGSGAALDYDPYDPVAGLAPGKVAVFFLVGAPSAFVQCPYPAARTTDGYITGTGIGQAFRLASTVPIVAYQMLPFGGGSAAVTGASLLIPTSAWGTNYIAASAYENSDIVGGPSGFPSMNFVAVEDGTELTVLPAYAIVGGPGVAGSPAGTPVTYMLGAGQVLQLTQQQELTGSVVQSNKPVGSFAGHVCMNVPASSYFCDHAEQSIPPVAALGQEYAAVGYRPRDGSTEDYRYRIVGAVEGTQLTFEPKLPGVPSSIDLAEISEFWSKEPFVVRSQNEAHPFMMLSYMTSQQFVGAMGLGDADFVRVVPPAQWLRRYVFFTDPTYPETNLVVTRKKSPGAPVTLVCAGALSGWMPVGASDYEFTRIDVSRHDFEGQNGCDNGEHEMTSSEPFGLTVWGWGSTETSTFTINVSYGYPAGESISVINAVEIPVPK